MYGRNNTFKTFLALNPQLVNGGLFLHYYSKQRMLLDAEARSRFETFRFIEIIGISFLNHLYIHIYA